MPRKSSKSKEGGQQEDGQYQALCEVVGDSWNKLDQLWTTMGHDPPVMLKRKTIVIKHVKVLFLLLIYSVFSVLLKY